LRFLEHICISYPGIELIFDAELSSDSDPYLREHAFQGEQLLPAVMGMEAMAQAAMALEQSQRLPMLKDLRFEHPIVIPKNKPVMIRIAALRREPGVISAVVRCSSTGFQIDHFSATCIFENQPSEPSHCDPISATETVSLDPSHDLYGHILFHEGRFCRVEGYQRLHAEQSIAQLKALVEAPYFARHLPPRLVLGDAASRDAALHSIQACIPHRTILPAGIDRVTTYGDWTGEPVVVHATERRRDGDNFTYDLHIKDATGRIREHWEGLQLRAVAPVKNKSPWALALLVPYLERRLTEIWPSSSLKIALTSVPQGQHNCRAGEMLREVLGLSATLMHRPDGKPEVSGLNGPHPHVSLSHCGEITLLVSAGRNIGCDLEKIVQRDSATWEQMLGAEEFALARLMASNHISLDCAATQVWTLKEGLRKAGAPPGQPTSLSSVSNDGWSSFHAGGFRAATFYARIQESSVDVVFGFVIGSTE
ncbi:MAG TPA: polyketide synthase dehydratase domain-containing protein, partial [Candidatus Sulfotelmatobacter sp.]|nr:polyketide synthase dehydratase domain-containing protein [Candidatus Sulfotelmatobacter sp.]